MSLRPLPISLVLSALLLVATGCSSGEEDACSTSNCNGCCDAEGACQPGFMVNACGAQGAACSTCGTSEVCVSGYCVASSEGDAGTQDAGAGNSLTGELAFVPVNARVSYHSLSDGGWELSYVNLALVDQDVDICTGPVSGNFEVLSVAIGMPYPGEAVVTPGTYTVDNQSATSPSGGVQLFRGTVVNGTLGRVFSEAEGTITLSQVDTSRVRGSFAVEFVLADGGMSPLNGTFDALACE